MQKIMLGLHAAAKVWQSQTLDFCQVKNVRRLLLVHADKPAQLAAEDLHKADAVGGASLSCCRFPTLPCFLASYYLLS